MIKYPMTETYIVLQAINKWWGKRINEWNEKKKEETQPQWNQRKKETKKEKEENDQISADVFQICW